MSFRNRPVLDRKHRPRWQDELRTQRLTVAGFAVAIAAALGILAATVWSTFYDANLQEVAYVGGVSVSQAEMTRQVNALSAELSATYLTLQGQMGGASDVLINQQLQGINNTLSAAASTASDELVTSLVLRPLASQFGIAPTAADVDAEVTSRRTHPTLLQLSLLMVTPKKAADAAADAAPTQEEWDAAKASAQDFLDQINGGADFATLAANNSDDSSKAQQGLLGWIDPNHILYGNYYTAAADSDPGTVLGPLKNDTGWYLLKVDDRQAAGRNDLLDQALAAAGVSDKEFRSYISDGLLRSNSQGYFTNSVIARYEPQRKVAQIFIAADQGPGVPKERIRHILVQPIPGQQDQSTATQEQWDAALAKIKAIRAELTQPNADWTEIAKQSDDTASASNGGILGWYEQSALASQFVPEFAAAAADLKVGELSEPVQSQYGYHIIEVMETRTSARDEAIQIVGEARADPASFGDLALKESEDTTTAANGGELGWVAPYQVDAVNEQAIFALNDVNQISDPVVTSTGYYIYKLEDTSAYRYLPDSQRSQVTSSGYTRWLTALKDQAGIWVDPAYAAPASTG